MLPRHDKYPIPCARVHDAMGAEAFPLRASTGRIAHQNEQRAAVEFSLLNAGRDGSAVAGPLKLARILPLGGFPQEPRRSGKAIRRTSGVHHRSSPEGFADNADQPLRLRLAGRHLPQEFQGRNDGRQQDQNVAGEG